MGLSKAENVYRCMPDFSPWVEKGSMELRLERNQILYLQNYWQRTLSEKDGESLALSKGSGQQKQVFSQTRLCVHMHVHACLGAFCLHRPPLGLLGRTGVCKRQGVCVWVPCVCTWVWP